MTITIGITDYCIPTHDPLCLDNGQKMNEKGFIYDSSISIGYGYSDETFKETYNARCPLDYQTRSQNAIHQTIFSGCFT